MRSIVSSIGAGPTAQFTPTIVAPRFSSSGANRSGGVPSSVLPSSSVVICAMIGRSEMPRTASMAAPISFRSRNVSRTNRSTPPSRSACACSRKYSRASSTPVFPHGSMRMPSGPMAPATYARPSAACRAILAPCSLIACSLSASPNVPSLIRFAPNVLVSIHGAPARTYSWCTSATRSGCAMFSASKLLLMKTPFAYSIVPIAPSHTSTRSSIASLKVCIW